MSVLDKLIVDFDNALRIVSGVTAESRSNPGRSLAEEPMSEQEIQHSAGLMRINHVGEVCAQALYDSQKRFAKEAEVKDQLNHAGIEEGDHLAWTAERVHELGSHLSLLNPLWYAGSYVLGTLAGLAGDKKSLGFVVETERQVEAHLTDHLARLPVQDYKSRAIVEQMRTDEIGHGDAALALGGEVMPKPIQQMMKAMSKVMTTVAYRL